jgi:N-acyl-L-homoserine lactone synthetase
METKIARTPEELEQVFKLRYQVYVEQEQKFGGINFPDKKMYDEFDNKSNSY